MARHLNATGQSASPLLASTSAAAALGASLGLISPNALAAPAAGQTEPASYVLLGGSVYTVNDKQPWAQSVAVRGNRIVYMGNNKGARAYIGKGTRSIDLKGKLLLPGFVESHIHLLMGAATSSG